MEKLSGQYGVNLFIKRDDQTGLAFGGNKARKLDFVMADALAQGADSIITWAGVQSNWCRQVAAAARSLGIHPVLLVFTRPKLPRALDGNLLLDLIYEADIHTRELGPSRKMMTLDSVGDLIHELAEKESRAGRKPYIAPIGASLLEGSMRKPLGAIAYVNGFLELLEQAEARKIHVDAIVVATGSGSTHAGLAVGAKLLSPTTKVAAISVSGRCEEILPSTRTIAQETTAELCGTNGYAFDPRAEDLVVFDQYMQEGYGIPDRATIQTIRLVAKEEGILLDPVYTGKAAAALLDLVKNGYFKQSQNIVLWHTGGTPAIFPYRDAFQEYLSPHGFGNAASEG